MSTWCRYKGLVCMVGLVVALPWFVYRVAIVDNITKNMQTKEFKKKITALDAKIGMSDIRETAVLSSSAALQSGYLIPEIMNSEAWSGCKIVKFTPHVSENRNGITVYTAELVLSGTYTALLKLMEKTENRITDCRIVSVSFRSIWRRQEKTTELHMTLILQQITNK